MISNKKITIIIIINSFANAHDLRVGFIPSSIGMSISNSNEINPDIDIKFLCISFEYYKSIETGLNITWVPVNYNYILNNHYWSFINFELFWNVFAIIPDEYRYERMNNGRYRFTFFGMADFGPFAYINYAPNLNFQNYMLSYGVKYILGNTDLVHGYLLKIECGTRIMDIKNYFYFNIGVDIAIWSYELIGILDAVLKYRRLL